MAPPNHLRYTKEHEWLLQKGQKARVGITAYALEQLGDVVYLELPKVGKSFSAQEPFGTIESTKTVSDLYMPISGIVCAVNEELVSDPGAIVGDPYEKGWLIEVEITQNIQKNLMDSIAYTHYLQGLS